MAPRPTIGLLLGDRNGVGPELVAKLLSQPDVGERARVIVIGDPEVFRAGQEVAGVEVAADEVRDPAEAPAGADDGPVVLVSRPVPAETHVGEARADAGREVLANLDRALALAEAGAIDGVLFAPFNKQAMHLGGLTHEDELRYVADRLGFEGMCGEINVLDELWTSRVTSHVPLRAVADLITPERVRDAVLLIDGALKAAGKAAPRVAVAGLNPHAGEGGVFGREEIDVVAPGVELARAAGARAVEGPFPADTLFLKARDGLFDAVVSMYHDQGQIALKLMGFERGVTVLGGLPVPIATPAHGTAYDIAGRGRADPRAIRRAFELCARMAAAHRRARGRPEGARSSAR